MLSTSSAMAFSAATMTGWTMNYQMMMIEDACHTHDPQLALNVLGTGRIAHFDLAFRGFEGWP